MAIKISLGKLRIDGSFESVIVDALGVHDIGLLPIEPRHVLEVVTLPYHHRDPFDRLFAAQCRAEGLSIVSADACFDAYGVARIW